MGNSCVWLGAELENWTDKHKTRTGQDRNITEHFPQFFHVAFRDGQQFGQIPFLSYYHHCVHLGTKKRVGFAR